MNKRFENIKQAEHSIQMFDWQASDGSSILLKGEQVSAAYARSCVVDALKTFIMNNKDNPLVMNPFDKNGMYEDKDFLFQAYDMNLALSNWDMIKQEYGKQMDALVTEALPKRTYHSDTEYEGTMLSLGSYVYCAMQSGLTKDQIDTMLEHSMTDYGYVNGTDLEYLTEKMISYPSQAMQMYALVHPEARQAVDFYLDVHPYDENMVMVLGAAKDMGEAFEAWQAFEHDGVSVQELGHVVEAVNLLVDRRKQEIVNADPETMTFELFQAKERGLDLSGDGPKQVVSGYLADTQQSSFSDYLNRFLEQQAEKSANDLTRLAFEDKGVVSGTNGCSYHQVDFVYACDQKTFGTDANMPNPYVYSISQKGMDGSKRVCHSCYLSESVYKRLLSAANTEGLSASRWTGVVEAHVKDTPRCEVDLTKQAFADGRVVKPKVPFAEAKHDDFVKASLTALRAKSRPLPSVRMEEPEEDISMGYR